MNTAVEIASPRRVRRACRRPCPTRLTMEAIEIDELAINHQF